MLKVIEGDILKAKEGFICHQVNCQGVMGGGIAAQIRKEYPDVYVKYVNFVKEKKKYGVAYDTLLGEVLFVPVTSKETGYKTCIANIFGQDTFGTKPLETNYRFLFEGILNILREADLYGQDVAIPWNIGCYRGGGDWDNIVYPFIKAISIDFRKDIVLYRFNK